jgi:hypothetical protein
VCWLQSLLQQDGGASSKKPASAAAVDDPAASEQKDDHTGPEAESKAGTDIDSAATEPQDVAAAAAGDISQQLVRLSLSAGESNDAAVTVNLTAA